MIYQIVDYMYDLTMAMKNIDGRQPNLIDVKNGRELDLHIYLRRIPISSIPVDNEEKCTAYLQKLYQEKVCSLCLIDRNDEIISD